MGVNRWTAAKVNALEKLSGKLTEKIKELDQRLTHLECDKPLVKTDIVHCDLNLLGEVNAKLARTLWALKQLGGGGNATDVAKLMGNCRSNASMYLCTLRSLGVVRSERKGRRKIFFLAEEGERGENRQCKT